jgi:predicted DNA-binding protein (MmcQ/YjbR family)
MYVDQIRDYCLSLPMVVESMPFGQNHVVFKVSNKMFLLVGLEESPIRFNVKCDPDTALALREQFPDSVFPGWHMNKKHWNTVYVNGHLADSLLMDFIFSSYSLVHPQKYM